MAAKNDTRAKIRIRGTVQGVGFRYFVLQRAQECRLKGYTMNLPTGEVEVVVEGDKVFIEDLYKAVQRGPSKAKVTEATIQWEEPKGSFRTFEIKR
ncbi:acylphosphatase [Leptospira langatensis]|uniref:acylphosphatase n=1 Tax=Leptospira langatensis TaxID=2484983 RepID=A0A5F1ZX84_9LEPT|nr:acylphosphatase [Leptospira langatensis]TGK01363.1 acylphosphatase [Leptospira langatensis]TGL42185.1 acylphosphatase [Leptospira langatensis]